MIGKECLLSNQLFFNVILLLSIFYFTINAYGMWELMLRYIFIKFLNNIRNPQFYAWNHDLGTLEKWHKNMYPSNMKWKTIDGHTNEHGEQKMIISSLKSFVHKLQHAKRWWRWNVKCITIFMKWVGSVVEQSFISFI